MLFPPVPDVSCTFADSARIDSCVNLESGSTHLGGNNEDVFAEADCFIYVGQRCTVTAVAPVTVASGPFTRVTVIMSDGRSVDFRSGKEADRLATTYIPDSPAEAVEAFGAEGDE